MEKLNGVGFISYERDGAPTGVIDACAGGLALTGIDEAVRYFNRQQHRGFADGSYEIPVYTGEGSWVAVVLGIAAIPITTFASAYAKKAAEKMAEKDFADTGFRDIARKSMDALVRLVELIKHMNGMPDWSAAEIRWSRDASVAYIYDKNGAVLEVPAEYVKWYKQVPKGILRKLSAPIVGGGSATFGAQQENGNFRSVNIGYGEASLLKDDEDVADDSFLFPELKHGEEIELEGLITRGNQSTNSIGFQYKDHILNCVPESGNVRRFKAAMFLHCMVTAIINRHVGSLARVDNRPTLIIKSVRQLEDDNSGQRLLFE